MGTPPQSLLDSSNPSNVINGAQRGAKVISQTRRKHMINKQCTRKKYTRVMHMKKRRTLLREGSRSRRGENRIERRVRTLKRLIPNRESEGVEGLFRDTATYIMSLQMKVRVMQIMVDALASSPSQHHQY